MRLIVSSFFFILWRKIKRVRSCGGRRHDGGRAFELPVHLLCFPHFFLPFAFLCVSAFLYSIDVAKAYVQVQVQQLPNDVVFLLVICCLIIHFSND